MNKEKYVFAQLISFLNEEKFRRIVNKYQGNRYIKYFTCWNQLLSLMFGQLSNRESLQDLIVALDAHHSKCYHLGMGRNVSRSSLARTNQNRDYHIFEEYAYYLVNEARKKRVTDIFKLGGNVYAFDSTTIDLCLSVFWWAKFRKKKGGIKIHTSYDVETQIPAYFHITAASVYDSKAMNEIPYETGSYYIFVRACNNFYSGPTFKNAIKNNDRIIVSFDQIALGLHIANKYGYIEGFAIAGVDQKFVWAKAYLDDKDRVVVYSDKVKDPVAVRYCWSINPDVNLFNSAGLPASPFRTDNWKISSEN